MDDLRQRAAAAVAVLAELGVDISTLQNSQKKTSTDD